MVDYHEQFPEQLERVYRGRNGYLYTCAPAPDICLRERGIWTATHSVEIATTEVVPDVYAEILEACQRGEIRVIRYESLSEEKREEITEMMKTYIIRSGFFAENDAKAQFFCENFSRAWELAQVGQDRSK